MAPDKIYVITSKPLEPNLRTELGGTVPIPSEVPSLVSSASFVTATYTDEILFQVAFPTTPSAVRLKILWNFVTAAFVVLPNLPGSSVITGIAG